MTKIHIFFCSLLACASGAHVASACQLTSAQVAKVCALRASDEGKTDCGKNPKAAQPYIGQCVAACGFESDDYYSDYYQRVTGHMPPGDPSPFPPAAPVACGVPTDTGKDAYYKKYCQQHPGDASNCGGGNVGGAWMCADGSPCGPAVSCLDNSTCQFYQ